MNKFPYANSVSMPEEPPKRSALSIVFQILTWLLALMGLLFIGTLFTAAFFSAAIICGLAWGFAEFNSLLKDN